MPKRSAAFWRCDRSAGGGSSGLKSLQPGSWASFATAAAISGSGGVGVSDVPGEALGPGAVIDGFVGVGAAGFAVEDFGVMGCHVLRGAGGGVDFIGEAG